MNIATNWLKVSRKQFIAGIGATVMVLASVISPMAAYAAETVSIEADVKVANVTAGDTSYSDSVNASVDQIVKVQVWYHNRENFDSGKVADDLKVGVNIPGTKGKSQTITGVIGAKNSNTVTDTAKVNLSLDNAYLEYVAGSAKWRHNKGADDGRAVCQTGAVSVPTNDPNSCYVTETVSDSIATSSTGLVLEDLQPCFAHEATVTVLARVKASEVSVNKYVSKNDGDQNVSNNTWVTKNAATPSEKLDYMIRFENKGNTRLDDVIVGDNLPDYMDYVAGTTRIFNTNNPNGISANSDNVTKGGINVGSYEPGSTGYVVFSVKINDVNKFAQCGVYTLKNVGVVRPKGMNEFYNTAITDVNIVCKPGETPKTPETPSEVPGELPSTGPVSLLGGLFGSSALGLGVHSWFSSRRALKNALKG